MEQCLRPPVLDPVDSEMWLFDKDGKLAEPNAREDLAGKVEKLLGP